MHILHECLVGEDNIASVAKRPGLPSENNHSLTFKEMMYNRTSGAGVHFLSRKVLHTAEEFRKTLCDCTHLVGYSAYFFIGLHGLFRPNVGYFILKCISGPCEVYAY